MNSSRARRVERQRFGGGMAKYAIVFMVQDGDEISAFSHIEEAQAFLVNEAGVNTQVAASAIAAAETSPHTMQAVGKGFVSVLYARVE